jgi:hypothetical protein
MRVYVRGLCRTYGAPDFWRRFPGLPAWAKLCRAYGAGLERRRRGGPILPDFCLSEDAHTNREPFTFH